MKNKAHTLLLLLVANKELGEPAVGKTVIVKQLYLAELLRPSYRLWSKSFNYVNYFYGPYSKEVVGHLNVLVFHGLATCTHLSYSEAATKASFVATPRGCDLAQTFDQCTFSLCRDLVLGLQALSSTTRAKLVDLVYAEPAFSEVRSDVKSPMGAHLLSGQDVKHHSFIIQRLIEAAQLECGHSPLPPRELVLRFLKYLSVCAEGKRITHPK